MALEKFSNVLLDAKISLGGLLCCPKHTLQYSPLFSKSLSPWVQSTEVGGGQVWNTIPDFSPEPANE